MSLLLSRYAQSVCLSSPTLPVEGTVAGSGTVSVYVYLVWALVISCMQGAGQKRRWQASVDGFEALLHIVARWQGTACHNSCYNSCDMCRPLAWLGTGAF
jgi:hypothetical protein